MSIPCFIPSKDRAQQLNLLLNSFERNAPRLFEPTILYTYSNDQFAAGYERIFDGPKNWDIDINPQYEYNAEEQFYAFLQDNADKNELIALFSDDCIFYRPTTLTEKDIRFIFNDENVWTFTYRLGRNVIIRDYVQNRPAKQPEIFQYLDTSENYLVWDLNSIDFWDIFGFATGFDGYIYRARDLLDLSEGDSFGRICFWENMICKKFNQNKPDKWIMACPILSEVVVEQINITHGFTHNTTGKFNASLIDLNNELLSDREIDLSSISFDGVNCSHGEYPFIFKEL